MLIIFIAALDYTTVQTFYGNTEHERVGT